MRRALALVLLTVAALPAWAQAPPFDMAPERPAAAPASGAPPATMPAPAAVTVPAAPPGAIRPIVPYRYLTLAGEYDTRTWTVYLTAEQAASPATLHVSYLNALLVAPEVSSLTLSVNDRTLVSERPGASSAPADLAVQVPPGLLQAGANRFRVIARQRHRTDCSIESTFDLWTEIRPEGTYLSFADATVAGVSRLADLRAVGVDDGGGTTVNIVVPGLDQPGAGDAIVELAQALALRIDAPAPVVRVAVADPGGAGPGELTAILGTVAEVGGMIGAAEIAGPSIGFLAGAEGSTLVVTGRDWAEVGVAVASLASPLQPPAGSRRTALSTASWHYPDAPLLYGDDRLTLAELGVVTTEFSGRRFRTSFAVGMPADLYAQAYGHAQLLLDAAYASDVLPTAHIDVYVNGLIATTTPIVNSGGGIFRHLAIDIPLHQFRPGVNVVEVEASLPTRSDVACAPGATGSAAPRFVLFDSTEFVLPAYARAVQLPDLAALAGVGYPLAVSPVPVPVVLGGEMAPVASAAATLIGRLAMGAGQPLLVDVVTAGTVPAAPYGLYVGTAAQMPAAVIAGAGLEGSISPEWRDAGPGSVPVLAPDPANDLTFERWREALSDGGGWRGQISGFSDWLQRTFDLNTRDLLFGGAGPLDYVPPDDAGVLLAQGAGAAGTSWAVLTAPSAASLATSTEGLVHPDNWRWVSGQASIYRPAQGAVEAVPLEGADIAIASTTPANLRLVATNWLSKNLLVYGGLLVGLCILLGIVTSWLLKSAGRH